MAEAALLTAASVVGWDRASHKHLLLPHKSGEQTSHPTRYSNLGGRTAWTGPGLGAAHCDVERKPRAMCRVGMPGLGWLPALGLLGLPLETKPALERLSSRRRD